MPKLSIIVTAYNIEAYIRESLDGILAQSLSDIEVIVVDDGSKDATAEIIREYAARDARIQLILFEENTIGGVATAANAGMDIATGEFIGFADGDDLYDPAMFQKLYEAAIAQSADLAMCRYELLDESDGQLKEPAEADRWRPYSTVTALDLDEAARHEILRFISVPWRKIYRRDLVERVNLRFPVGDFFFEDNPFHWQSVLSAERIALVPERLCKHRVARAGQTMATVDSRLLRIFRHHDIIRDWLIQQRLEGPYRMDLLGWFANQLSWVSQRAEGTVLQELYDIASGIAAQYSPETIEAFGDLKGRGRTYNMLTALKAGDQPAFAKAAHGGGKAVSGRAAPRGSLVSRGWYHLRNSGVRNTARMVGTYTSERLGIKPIGARAGTRQDQNQVSNEDLMAAMAILQADLRRLRDEVSRLRAGPQAKPADSDDQQHH